MRDKSKFIGFILSLIPGLAHLYIGLRERAFIFLGMLGLGGLASVFIAIAADDGEVGLALFMMGYALLWLIALLDLFSAWKYQSRIKYGVEKNEDGRDFVFGDVNVMGNNKKTTAMALSIVPGAGHMFLGYQNKGLMIMGSFFFSIFFMGWLGISFLLFLLPLIWFYGFFDAMHIVDGTEEATNQKFELPNIKPEWIGMGLISVGIIIVLERILYPLLDYRIRRYIQTSIVSLIFIIAGIIMLRKDRVSLSTKEDKEDMVLEEDSEDED